MRSLESRKKSKNIFNSVGCKPDPAFNRFIYFQSVGFLMYEDKTLVCKDCGAEFVFTAGEQEFYAEKGFENEPSRCKECRIARKNSIRQNREMHTAICADCGKEAQVPFEPKEDRAVYCSECFAKHKGE